MTNLDISYDYDIMIRAMVENGVDYIEQNKIKSLVLGVSGGVDSAVVAAIARKVCDIVDIPLCGQSMPIISNKDDEILRAGAVGEEFCDVFGMKDLRPLALTALEYLEPALYNKNKSGKALSNDDRVAFGNIKARIRMINLYGLARSYNGMVLSTDNFTEFNLGFWTLHGDVGDYGFIQELWKTEVYGLAKLLGGAVAECADANPTDGLGITNSDIDQLLPEWTQDMGSHIDAYKLVDDILIDHMSGRGNFSKDHPVIKRHESTHFKRANPVSIRRELLRWRHI